MNQGNNILILNYKISGNHQRHLTLLQHSLNSPALLLTEVGDVLQDCYSMEGSSLLHLTDPLPGVVLLVLQDVLQIIYVNICSSCKLYCHYKHYKIQ